MTNEERLIIEVVLFVIVMLGVIAGTAFVVIDNRKRSPKAIKELREMVDEMAENMNARMDEYEERQARARQEMDRLHVELSRWKNYSRKLVNLLHEMGYTGDIPEPPEPPVSSPFPRPRSNSESDRLLARELAAAFNLEDLTDLAFHLGIAADEVPGGTVSARARELVRYCRRRGMTEQLRETAAEMRPGRNV